MTSSFSEAKVSGETAGPGPSMSRVGGVPEVAGRPSIFEESIVFSVTVISDIVETGSVRGVRKKEGDGSGDEGDV